MTIVKSKRIRAFAHCGLDAGDNELMQKFGAETS
jgi:hypothetical protein